jgi:hydroxymethylbilane synthase
VRSSILVGSRGSALAIAQTNEVIKSLREINPASHYQVVPIKTRGDKLHELGASALEGKSLFTREIEESLINDEIQIAVHSMKDLTTDLPSGLTIAAVPRRADHRDALISRSKRKFDQLPSGARVGTSSPRRRTQLLAARSDLEIVDMQGNVDTRLRKLEAGDYDAIVLAAVGLMRLGLEKRATELLSMQVMLPAVGQGALALETREDDRETLELISRLDDKSTRKAVEAERAFARKLGANCRTPIAAYARVHDGRFSIDGMVASRDGRMLLRTQLVSDNLDSTQVGEELAESLLKKGAQLVLEAA